MSARPEAPPGATLALLCVFAGELRAALLRLFLYGAALGTIGLVAAEFVTRQQFKLAAAPAPAPEWIDVIRPIPAFALSIAEFGGEPQYAIQRHVSGGGRKDIFTFSDAEAPGATAVVEIYRPGSEAGQWGGSDDMTASIPDLRLSVPAAARMIETKFGPAGIESFTDSGPQGERSCLRFARRFDDPRLAISGTFCNAGREIVDHGMVACALDRLSLLAAGSDPKVGALFARAELNRSFCGQRSVFLAATPKRADWIEAARDPKLRGLR